MDIICDEDIPTRSEQATKAKSRAKSILNAFQKEAKDTKDRLANITEVTNTVGTFWMWSLRKTMKLLD